METWQMGKQTRERRRLRNLKVKRAGLLWGPRRRQPPLGRPAHMGLRPAAQSGPAGACTGPQKAHGEGSGGRGWRGVASPPGTWRREEGGEEEVCGDREELGVEPTNRLD